MSNGVAAAGCGALETARGFAHRLYHRLAAVNYDRRLRARRNRTPAGSFRCYEPLNRHGDDEMLAELDAACGPSAAVVDVGANVGIYALALASGAPDRRIVALEPSPAVADRVRANVPQNGLEDRIDVRRCAAGDADGDRRFYRASNPELSAFDRAAATRWGSTVAEVRSVPVRRLDSLVAGIGTNRESAGCVPVPPPDAVKIDVEGAAPAVLRGARETLERHRPLVFLEVHADGISGDVPRETRGLLEAAGYAVSEREGYWRCEPA